MRCSNKMKQTLLTSIQKVVCPFFIFVYFSSFLGAPKHLYDWLCLSVCPSACNTFDDPNGAPYRPTSPCFSFSFIQAPIFVTQWLSENQAKMMTAESCASWKRRYSQRSIPEPKCYWRKAVTKSNSLYLTKHQFTVEHARQNGDEMEF